MSVEPMSILMTGSAGFIGQHLIRELVDAGHFVRGVDRKYPEDEYLGDLNGRTGLCDISEPGAFKETMGDKHLPDLVIHLAAQVGREFGEDDVARTINWNATGTAMVAHACGQHGVPVLYTSTSEVYGDLGPSTVADEINGPFLLPHNLYGVSKRWGEEVLRLYAPDGLKIARLSMPYGPGAPPGRGRRAMDNFLWHANHRRQIPVHEGATRSWCWVGDTVRGLRMIAEVQGEGVWNVGRDDDNRSLEEVAQIACDLAGAPRSLINMVQPPAMQTVVKKLRTQRLRDLGWQPTVELEEGMERLWDWIRRFDADGKLVG